MEKLVEYNDKLNGLPAGAIIFLVCIAIGYALRVAEWFPNQRIPTVVMLCGSALFMLMAPSRRGQELRPYEEVMVARALRDALPSAPLAGISITSTNVIWDDVKASYLIVLKQFRSEIQAKNIAVIISPRSVPTRIWLTRNFCIGWFVGFAAWMARKLVLRKIEKRFNLFDETLDTDMISKSKKSID